MSKKHPEPEATVSPATEPELNTKDVAITDFETISPIDDKSAGLEPATETNSEPDKAPSANDNKTPDEEDNEIRVPKAEPIEEEVQVFEDLSKSADESDLYPHLGEQADNAPVNPDAPQKPEQLTGGNQDAEDLSKSDLANAAEVDQYLLKTKADTSGNSHQKIDHSQATSDGIESPAEEVIKSDKIDVITGENIDFRNDRGVEGGELLAEEEVQPVLQVPLRIDLNFAKISPQIINVHISCVMRGAALHCDFYKNTAHIIVPPGVELDPNWENLK